jgi:hypothetical protein
MAPHRLIGLIGLALQLAALLQLAGAFLPVPLPRALLPRALLPRTTYYASSSPSSDPVSEISLSLLDDHSSEAELLSATLARHLDEAYYPHPSHKRIGAATAEAYVEARSMDFTAVSDVFMHVAEQLEGQGGMTGDGVFEGSFVNNYDVGNLVAAYLMQRVGAESADCNVRFPDLPALERDAAGRVGSLDDDFARHKFMMQIMDGEVPASNVLEVLGRVLARPAGKGKKKGGRGTGEGKAKA